MKWRHLPVLALLAVAGLVAGCASAPPAPTRPTAPRFAEYPPPEIPAAVNAPAALRARHEAAWQRLQSGDIRRATQEFTAILKTTPTFYPAAAGLGFAYLADRNFRLAEPRFAAVVTENDRYLPGWIGRADALIGLGRDEEAIDALERVVALDPKRETARTRLDLLRFRVTQSLIEAARRARAARRYDAAVADLGRALETSPQSTLILQELVAVELAAGRPAAAETHARRAVQLEPKVGEWHAQLGAVLEALERYGEAAASYNRAVAIEARSEWRTRAAELREKADAARLPAEFGRIASAATVTRGEVAAFIGIRLDTLIASAPRRVTDVATDVRTHWAASWILPVTRAGVMTIYPNHTFQPGATVRRGDLATIAAALVRLAAARSPELAKWQAARPRFADMPASHASYSAAALAVTARVMDVDANGRFEPTRAVTGRELDTLVERIARIADR